MRNFDSLLDAIGGWHQYQRRVILTVVIPASIATAFRLSLLFHLYVPLHHCDVDIPKSINISAMKWHEYVIPRSEECYHYQINSTYYEGEDDEDDDDNSFTFMNFEPEDENSQDNDTYDRMKEDRYQEEGLEYVILPNLTVCEDWVYDETYFRQTVASAHNWVCHKEKYINLAYMIAAAAVSIGGLFYAYLSDRVFGRKAVLFFQVFLLLFGLVGQVLLPSFWIFTLFLIISMASFPAVFFLPLIFASEIVDRDKRINITAISFICYAIGGCLLSLVSWLVKGYWFALLIVEIILHLPIILGCRSTHESPRWMLSRYRVDEAFQVCQKICHINGKINPEDLHDVLSEIAGEPPEKNECCGLFKNKTLLLRLFVVSFIWAAIGMAFFGLTFTIKDFSSSPFMNLFTISIIQMASFIIGLVLLKRIGTRVTQSLSIIISSIALFVASLIPLSDSLAAVTVTRVFAALSKIGVSLGFFVIHHQAIELYPTSMRALGVALGSAMAVIISISLPWLIELTSHFKPTAYLSMSGLLFIAFLLSLLLPDTFGISIVETMEQANNIIGHDQQFINIPATVRDKLKKPFKKRQKEVDTAV